MKTAGTIKLLLIAINVIFIFVLPWPSEPDGLLTSSMIPLVVLSIGMPSYYLFIWSGDKNNLKWPGWNVNLFAAKNSGTPLGNFDFFGALFGAIGSAMLISNRLNYNEVSEAGMTSVSVGIGVLIGMVITVAGSRMMRKKTTPNE